MLRSTVIYQFPLYLPVIVASIGVIFLLIGIRLNGKPAWRKIRVVVFFIALFSGGLIAPSMFRDRVVLDDQKLEQTTGFWFAQTRKGFKLAEVSSIRIGTAQVKRKQMAWYVTFRNGNTVMIDPGDLWEFHSDDIARRLKEQGIEVH